MLKRIALIAPRGLIAQKIIAQFSNPLVFHVREFASMADVQSNLTRHHFDALIARYPHFTREHASAVQRLRAIIPSTVFVSVAPEIDPAARFHARGILNHKIIDDTHELGDLRSAVDAMIAQESLRQRLHPRVKRVGEAEISDSDGTWVAGGEFLDFAQMGARLYVHRHEPIAARSRVQVAYRSTSDPERVHRIESQVVWSKIGIGQTIAVRFIAAL